MTKETKIGLLVGLAFIVLFAIILSEKGARRGVEPPVTTLVDGGGPATDLIPNLYDDGRLNVDQDLGPAVDPNTTTTEPIPDVAATRNLVPQGIPDEGTPLAELPPSLLQFLNRPMDLADASMDRAGSDAPVSSDRVLRPEADGGARDGTASSEVGLDPTFLVSDSPGRDSDSGRSARPSPPRDTPRSTRPLDPPSFAVRTVHFVEPGECLGKIAARYYGRASPERVRAIYDANRDVLRNIDSVRANDRLKIPDLEARADERFEPAPGFVVPGRSAPVGDRLAGGLRIPMPVAEDPSTTDRSPRSSRLDSASRSRESDPTFRWYEIRDKDSLSGIARRELGNEKRYNEIYRMNTDRLTDKHTLKPGTKIRLPMSGGSALSLSSGRLFDG